jgi:L-alanine-DL-glutamate epimerase-like enolase superfamily enzyme
MRITRLEVIPIALPFREHYRTASGSLSARSMVVVMLHTDGGYYGVGEAVPLSLRGGPSLGQVASELSLCGPALAGADAAIAASRDPAAIRGWIWEQLGRCRRRRVGPQVIGALDIALHDLAGRLSGMPMWRLLGATGVRGVRCNATLDAGEPDRAGELAARQRAAGYTTFKIKVGSGPDLARVAAVRSAVGSDAHIRIDANGAWDLEGAAQALGELQIQGIELAEQPCASVAELVALRSRTPIPIVADESVATEEQARELVAERACDAATLKLAKVGGPLEAIRMAAVLPCYLSSALDGPIGIAAAIHTAQAMPSAGYGAQFANGLATLGMFDLVYAHAEGLLGPVVHPPDAPGVGVEPVVGALEELRLS